MIYIRVLSYNTQLLMKNEEDFDSLKSILAQMDRQGTTKTHYDLIKMEPNESNDEWNIRIKKTIVSGN